VVLFGAHAADCRHSWHLYCLRLALGIDRAQFIRELHDRKIGSSVHFIPIPLHPFYAGRFDSSLFPKTMQLYPRLVSLPLYPSMTEKQVAYVIDCVKEIVGAARLSPRFV
jgi:dTDP-4-amino-4,6-dideoxygalactose transaminase